MDTIYYDIVYEISKYLDIKDLLNFLSINRSFKSYDKPINNLPQSLIHLN